MMLIIYKYVNILDKNINNMKSTTEALLQASSSSSSSSSSRQVGLEVNSEETKYMFRFRHQNAG
jgi:hypothetical protein